MRRRQMAETFFEGKPTRGGRAENRDRQSTARAEQQAAHHHKNHQQRSERSVQTAEQPGAVRGERDQTQQETPAGQSRPPLPVAGQGGQTQSPHERGSRSAKTQGIRLLQHECDQRNGPHTQHQQGDFPKGLGTVGLFFRGEDRRGKPTPRSGARGRGIGFVRHDWGAVGRAIISPKGWRADKAQIPSLPLKCAC